MPEVIDKTEDEQEEPEKDTAVVPKKTVSFPLGMAFIALCFDILERIPPITLLAPGFGLIMGFWQKIYAPKTDPVLGFFLSKIAAIVTMGLLPDNLSIVIYAFTKKRAEAKSKTIKIPEPSEQPA